MGRAGKALRQVLKTYGISQNQLAIAMGIAAANVSRWVSESRDPSAEAAFEIRQGLQKIDPAAAEEFVMHYMNKPNEEFELCLRPRVTETVSIEIPADTLESLKKVAASQDMSVDALLKFYIGKSLRQDLVKVFSERILDTTAQVLARHIESEEEISAILREIRGEAVG